MAPVAIGGGAKGKGSMAEGLTAKAGPLARVRGAAVTLSREEGQTLLEYALIVGFIGMATIAAMIALAPAIGNACERVTKVIGDPRVL
jgi:Flp pilus assembly pilin Flp